MSSSFTLSKSKIRTFWKFDVRGPVKVDKIANSSPKRLLRKELKGSQRKRGRERLFSFFSIQVLSMGQRGEWASMESRRGELSQWIRVDSVHWLEDASTVLLASKEWSERLLNFRYMSTCNSQMYGYMGHASGRHYLKGFRRLLDVLINRVSSTVSFFFPIQLAGLLICKWDGKQSHGRERVIFLVSTN